MDAATTAATEAKIQKAEQFQVMADIAIDLASYDAACSLAVSAAINASDAIILRGGLPLPSRANHDAAVTLLRKIAGNSSAKQLSAALGLKNKAQYQITRCSLADAIQATKRSGRLLNTSKGLPND